MEEYAKLKKGETIGVMRLLSRGKDKYEIFGKALKNFKYDKKLANSGIVLLTYKTETGEGLEDVRKFVLNKFKEEYLPYNSGNLDATSYLGLFMEIQKQKKFLNRLNRLSGFHSKKRNLEENLNRSIKLKKDYFGIHQFIKNSNIFPVIVPEAKEFYEEISSLNSSQKEIIDFGRVNSKLNSIYWNKVDSQEIKKSISDLFPSLFC